MGDAPKAGRPPVTGATRTRSIQVRVTEAEHQAAHARAKREGIDLGELVRRLLARGYLK